MSQENTSTAIFAGVATATILIAIGAVVYLYNENQKLKAELVVYRAAENLATTEQAQAHACINQLRMLDGAKQQWALEYKKDSRSEPDVANLLEYLRGTFPRCPSGGDYEIGNVVTPPQCSISGHRIP